MKLLDEIVIGAEVAQGNILDERDWNPINAKGIELGGLKGYVYNKETGDPIAGVIVAFALISDETDLGGYYELEDIPAGSQTVTFLKTGYQVAERQAEIVAGEWVTLDVELTPGEGPEPSGFPWLWLGLGAAAAGVGIVIAKRRESP